MAVFFGRPLQPPPSLNFPCNKPKEPKPLFSPTALTTRVSWVASGVTCDKCEIEVAAMRAYCLAQLPTLADVTLDLYACANCTAPPCSGCEELTRQTRDTAKHDARCCGVACACLPTCECTSRPPPSPPPPPPAPPTTLCTPLPAPFVEAAERQLRKFCALIDVPTPSPSPTPPPAPSLAAPPPRRADDPAAPTGSDGLAPPPVFASFCARFGPRLPSELRPTRCFGACSSPLGARLAAQRGARLCRGLVSALLRQGGGDVCAAACRGYVEPCALAPPPAPPVVIEPPEPSPAPLAAIEAPKPSPLVLPDVAHPRMHMHHMYPNYKAQAEGPWYAQLRPASSDPRAAQAVTRDAATVAQQQQMRDGGGGDRLWTGLER